MHNVQWDLEHASFRHIMPHLGMSKASFFTQNRNFTQLACMCCITCLLVSKQVRVCKAYTLQVLHLVVPARTARHAATHPFP